MYIVNILGCPWKLVSWFTPYSQDLQPTYIGVITHLLSTMEIPVPVDIQDGLQNQ